LKKKITRIDIQDWSNFINSKDKLENKDLDGKRKKISQEKTIDLHGYSLDNANKLINDFILDCYEKGVTKINVITGKGTRSKNRDNPYNSENLSILKYSVPEYINSNIQLMKKIKYINQMDIDNNYKGSFDIILKKIKE
tara:strand:- start:1172 stop:1588 length:417 start_codon:yes stop_codon:yes gene_type:complete